MNIRNTVGRRAMIATAGVALALASISAGAALTASAESDPSNMPDQEAPEWDAGPSLDTTMGNSGTPWVADQFAVEDFGTGWTSYVLIDGGIPSDDQAADLQADLGYALCSNFFDTQHVICSD
jgi:hypothetical protein